MLLSFFILKWSFPQSVLSVHHMIALEAKRIIKMFALFVFPRIKIMVQFSSITQSCPTVCDPTNHSTPGLPIHPELLESTQIHVHWVSDAVQPSHPLSSPSSPALNLSQHQGLFQGVSSSHEVVKVSEFQLQHRSFQWIFRTDFL